MSVIDWTSLVIKTHFEMKIKHKDSTSPQKGDFHQCQSSICVISTARQFKASSKTPKLTTWLCCAAVHCIVDQLLARLAAVRTLHRRALNRLTLDAHGNLVTNTGLTVTCPSLAQLFKRNTPIQIHTSYPLLRMHEHKSRGLTCLGFPSGPTQAERQAQTAGDVLEKNISKPSKMVFL